MTPTKPDPDTLPILRYSFLCVNAHKAQPAQRVGVVQICEDRVRIKALTLTQLGGRGKTLNPGETALVPKWSVKPSAPKTEKGKATSKRIAAAPWKHYLFTVETTSGTRSLYYRGKQEHAARQKALKPSNVIRVGKSHPVTEAQYTAGRKALGQKDRP